MNNAAYRPLSPFGLHRNLSRIFDDQIFPASDTEAHEATEWVPRVDIREDENAFTVQADVPGVDSKDIDVTLDKNVLTIRGSRLSESEVNETSYKRRERVIGNFIRQFTLPDSADGENITARSTNGVLSINIPKSKASQPRSIQVQSEH